MKNHYLIDESERLIYREELKRRAAAIVVCQERIQELRVALRGLDSDCDAAAAEHEAAAAELQRELSELDEARITDIVSGKSTPKKSIDRKNEILRELSELNQTLELRCEANKKAKEPIERQISELTKTILDKSIVENQLCSIASPETRMKLEICEHRRAAARFALGDAQRRYDIQAENMRRHDINAERKFDVTDERKITARKLSTAEALLNYWRAEVASLEAEGAELRAAALTE